ncbi:laccase-2-like [Haliotis rufescens]|uniref:laccase-2-like n=1 Tax=Haliotis rufescens TaxID=6454 RepID=UPI00201EF630|nr:laccase-2-like [Haliotis rufescens]
MMMIVLVTFLLMCHVTPVTSTCNMTADTCIFHLNISRQLTMVHKGSVVKVHAGKAYSSDTTVYNNNTAIPQDEVITGDGWAEPRPVLVFNNQMPGPPIEVYQGQSVHVHVTNNMDSDTTSIHWHGVHQKGTPWMDGVPFLTQCPILPGHTLDYYFVADRPGTYWYHALMAGQTMDGAFGPLIVRPRKFSDGREFILTIQDWNHSWDSQDSKLRERQGWVRGGAPLPSTTSPTGSKYTITRVDSGLVNGRGRYHNGTKDAPLTQFQVDQGLDYRFRTIHAGTMLPFRMSIDKHMLTIVALDGADVQPVTAESFIIYPGERVDFVIYADNAESNYWVRGVALESKNPRVLESVLHYTGAPEAEPQSARKGCTPSDVCLIVNCPFPNFTSIPYTKCISVDALKSVKQYQASVGKSTFREIFLNLAFPGYDSKPGSVNGRVFDNYPLSPPLTQQSVMSCNASECRDDMICHCPLVLDLQQGEELQLVLINMGQGRGWDNPVHIHGHHFHVVRTGYATYDKTTGLFMGDNLDVDCLGNPDRQLNFCNRATWGNPKWLNGNIPDANLQHPPEKDTVVVPNGGYVVVRLRADNPGLWLMHYGNTPHFMDGMALVLRESSALIPPTPSRFPVCGSFPQRHAGTLPTIVPNPTKGKPGIIG